MNSRHLVALVLAALVLLALAACEHKVTDYPPQPKQTAPVNRDIKTAVINVTWHDGVDSLSGECGLKRDLAYGCVKNMKVVMNTTFCDMHVMDAKDFDDTVRLVILGHELRHCFLAQHETVLR